MTTSSNSESNVLARDRVGAFVHDDPVTLPPTGSGPLDGLTCGVKDVFSIAGHVTGYGNPTWRDTHAPALDHSPAVACVLAAGARIVGKTHTDELAFSIAGNNHHYGAPVNSAAPERITGGSSSGSAAAVAANLCDFALGTDTGGSVRAPASFCGLYGIRTTHGVVSKEGVCKLAESFDAVGWFARDAELLQKIGQVLLPPDEWEGSFKAAAMLPQCWAQLGASDHAANEPRARELASRIGGVQDVVLQVEDFDAWFDVFRTLQFRELWLELGPWITESKAAIGPGLRDRFEAASKITDDDVARASRERERIRALLEKITDAGTLLVLPTMPGAAPSRNSPLAAMEAYRRTAMRLLCISGLAGLPQVTLPVLTAEGAPLGLSLIGPAYSDRALLTAAARLAR